ncbi:hypothetical protein ABZ943_10235 [Streptomyces rubiginosohelvolus]|uniref:hypothetical protein n=1 Tax=Streptomyces rubiginosohelvolus TaxID=67362 RepID=UPI0033F7F999
MHTSAHLLASTPDQLLPARELMAFTLASYIILVPLGIALPLITLVWSGLVSAVASQWICGAARGRSALTSPDVDTRG